MSDKKPIKATLVDTVGPFDLYEADDKGSVFTTIAGTKVAVGSAWGPAADRSGNWFVWRAPLDPARVADRSAAIAYITAEEATQ